MKYSRFPQGSGERYRVKKKGEGMKKGFTLVELIVVIAIIAILGAVVAPNAFKAVEKSRVSAAIGILKGMDTAIMQYYSDVGLWPAANFSSTSSNYLMTNVASSATWDGPYIDSWPAANPWGGTYQYTQNATARWIQISGLTGVTAAKLDMAIDGAVGTTTGVITYTNATSGVTVSYKVSSDS